jgi:type III restriction enzyme
MTTLVRYCYGLAKAIEQRIKTLRAEAISQGANSILFADAAGAVEASFEYGFTFKPNAYPVRNLYQGAWKFQKHYYGQQIDDMNDEEVECAKVIDAHPKVKHWVRNLESEQFGFWLPKHTGGHAYPDFVCELLDGRLAVIEYKGGQLITADDAKSKRRIGELWQNRSGKKGIFIMPTSAKADPQGRSLEQQVSEALN